MRRYVVKLTMEEAETLGIVRCVHCNLPRNNHFSWGKRTCAHVPSCPGWKAKFVMGRSTVCNKQKRRAKSPIHRAG